MEKRKMLSVLTIAGSDSSGGAGIQADIKTIEAHKIFAMSAITAITAQNTTGVYAVEDISPKIVALQIDKVFEDIRPDAVKIGMVSSPDIIMVIKEALVRHEARNIVVDPVMVATSGASLIEEDAVKTLRDQLLPLATVITPNTPEAEMLSGVEIVSLEDMELAAEVIHGEAPQAAIMVKGGHMESMEGSMDDLVMTNAGKLEWLSGRYIESTNTHGTGCTLSSAIACGLARGFGVVEACRQAKAYVEGAIDWGLDLGEGSGPLNHMWQYCG